MTQILTIIISLLAIVMGFWRYKTGKKKQKSNWADEAKKKFDEAEKNNDTSGITSGIDRINRL